jgi:hypothetical protein
VHGRHEVAATAQDRILGPQTTCGWSVGSASRPGLVQITVAHGDAGVTAADLFALRCGNCRLIEAWGVPYHRAQPGLHQIHSRRASNAVAEDLRGRDGAVRFYFDEDQRVELALLKFAGQ